MTLKFCLFYSTSTESWHAQSVIRLHTAFSRDQPEKHYVQHLLQEDAAMLYDLIRSRAAHVYVCGDASNMARDVHRALSHVIAEQGHVTIIESEQILSDMERQGRYQKDVWVT